MQLDLLRAFFAVAAHGSLNRAAERLRVSQSTLTRQMRALEAEVGGRLLERSTTGVALTAAGHALRERMQPLVARFDAALDETRQLARGQSARLRIGYLMSAAADYLQPALAALRRAHPEVTARLLDLSPGEQVEALRRGEIDLALLCDPGKFLRREFFVRKIASLPVLVALPETHALAAQPSVRLPDLRRESFIDANERDLPGHHAWVVQLCRKAGFRPRFIAEAESLTHGLATVVAEGAVDLLPAYASHVGVPGVVFRPLREPAASWDLLVAWQRGKAPAPLHAMLAAWPAVREESPEKRPYATSGRSERARRS